MAFKTQSRFDRLHPVARRPRHDRPRGRSCRLERACRGRFDTRRINHQDAYSLDGACTNAEESLFSRLRRAEIGHYHHLSGPYLDRYAREIAFREDHRRTANGEQFAAVAGLVARNGPSVDFCGYWQRARAA